MYLIIILLQICLAHSELHLNETLNKIKYILNHRHQRCVNGVADEFVKNTLSFFHRTDGLGKYLQASNVSSCREGEASSSYVREHIVGGLLIHPDVPSSHWHEYKAPMDYLKKLLKLRDTVPLHDPAHDPHRWDYHRHAHKQPPRQVDWRAKGFRPQREQQYRCGACYAFAVAHAVQGQLYQRHGDWSELSPQQIIDCSRADGNDGCEGGSLRATMRYAAREGLLMEKSYPYKGKRSTCRYSKLLVRARPRRWAFLPAGDEGAMELALAAIGPLAVAVNAAPFTFQLYKSGVYDDPFCTPWQLNHAMLLVGYTQEYWILLNWWGKQWGEDGYMRIRRGFNRCGVANMAAYAQL